MFSFVFKLKPQKEKWKININNHEILCSKNISQTISKKIANYIKSLETDSNNEKKDDAFTIQISQFDNPLICSESDYTNFFNIFNLVPVKINLINKDSLKIFAEEFEIDELKNIVEMFEKSYNTITEDPLIQVQKEITSKIMDITEENFDQTIIYIEDIFQQKDEDEESIASNDFLYSAVLTACQTRSHKIELLMKFLKELETRSNQGQFEYFKKMIVPEFKENKYSNEIDFVIRYLKDIKEIESTKVTEKIPEEEEEDIGEITYYNEDTYGSDEYEFEDENGNIIKKNGLSKEQLNEYSKSGYNPLKIYQAIKNDDIELFSQLMAEESDDKKFNKLIKTLKYERNSMLSRNYFSYIDLCAFYGSEKVFNYIMMNIDSEKIDLINIKTTSLAFAGGNITIIQKCFNNDSADLNVSTYIKNAVEYNRNEVFEWLLESNDSIITNAKKLKRRYGYYYNFFFHFNTISEEYLFEKAIQFNNFDALFYMFSIGFDYTSLFSFALLYNNFYLAKVALKLGYNCNKSSPNLHFVEKSPFLYKHNSELPIFIAIYKNRLDFVKKIVDSGLCSPGWRYEQVTPLTFAIIYDRIDIFKYLADVNIFPISSKVNDMTIFEYAIQQNQQELIDFLLKLEKKNLFGHYTNSILDIHTQFVYSGFDFIHSPFHTENYNIFGFSNNYNYSSSGYYSMSVIPIRNSLLKYAKNLIAFFLDDSENKKEIKTEIVAKNNSYLFSIAVRIYNESEFVKFTEKYKLNIDDWKPREIF
ncbi:hypothetical protein M9Y10_023640 [Tritrichomonas musculus]|uniref:DUF3447 domain-containing protein n=1 Tax=Tritrichomonas musculus TaxID=1915356 RepID=A0ABR2KVX9_9EUKA